MQWSHCVFPRLAPVTCFPFASSKIPSTVLIYFSVFFVRSLVVLSSLNNHEEALSFRERALGVYVDQLGEHPFTATLYNYMGNDCLALGNFDKAVDCFSKALSIRKNFLGNCHQDTARTLHDLGVAYKMKVIL